MSTATAREAACKEAWRKVPALRGVKPTVRMAGPNHEFTFKKSEPAANGGPTMRHVVKVTVDGAGKVVKVVMGR